MTARMHSLVIGVSPAALLLACGWTAPALAQQASPPAQETLSPDATATAAGQPQDARDPVAAPGAPAADREAAADVVVTGSYIARPVQANASPVSLIGAAEIATRGVQSVEGLLATLPSNGLSRRFSDTIGSPYTVGTSQLNLRGLGPSSTLTLINGRRQTLSSVPDADGASFVDINPIPLIMIERLEVLTDGASAIYGSDAVAGVANFIMRRRLDGVELRGNYASTTHASQEDITAGVAAGFSSGSLDVVVGADYLRRTPLGQDERDYATLASVSGTGFPGAFQPITGGGASRRRDPNCTQLGGVLSPGNFCGINVARFFDLVPREDRVSSYAVATLALGGGTEAYAEAGYSYSKVSTRSAPSYTNTSFPIVPANNPGNLVVNGGFGVPVYFFGRPFGNPDTPAALRPNTLQTYRGVLGVRGPISPKWRYDASVSFSQQTNRLKVPGDVNIERFNAALNGRGGPNNNLFFNPFGSALLNPALANSPEVIADFSRVAERDYRSNLTVVDAVVTGQLTTLSGGPLSLAVGGQFRREELDFKADADQQGNRLSFLFSGPNFNESRSFQAAFVELEAPFADWLTANVAARYENVDGTGSTFNPKGSLRIEPTKGIVLRGSIGTSFRAPSLSQLTPISTINTAIADPLNQSAVPFFTIVRTVEGEALEPEKSLNFNLGAVWRPSSTVSFSVDYYNYRYRDLIVKQDAQTLVNANPLDPRIDRLAGAGPIRSIAVSFVNAQTVRIQGLDFAGDLRAPVFGGTASLTARASYLIGFRADIGLGRDEQLAGLRNYQNFAPPLPRWRANLNANYTVGPHSFTITPTYVGPVRENYANRADPNNGFRVGDFTTIDAQYALRVDSLDGEFAVGVQNLFNQEPRRVLLTSVELTGFDRQLHDPRGTIVYGQFRVRFR